MDKIISLILLLTANAVSAGSPSLFESFEGHLPDYITPSRPEMVSFSPDHYKEGTRSLRWDWQPGDKLTIRHGIGDIKRMGGYGGTYAKATFGVWVYCEKPQSGALRFQFRHDDKITGEFEFPLDFNGWRRANLGYTYQSQFTGKITKEVNNIVILAPTSAPGTGFIDLLVYNGLMDTRQQYLPRRNAWHNVPDPKMFPRAWPVCVPDPKKFPLPKTVSQAEQQAIAAISAGLKPNFSTPPPAVPTAPDSAAVKALEARFAAFHIVPGAGTSTTGAPLAGAPGGDPLLFYTGNGITGVQTPEALTNLMLDLAMAHSISRNPELRRKLASMYFLAARHLADQGYSAGSGSLWSWYAGRNLAEASFLMRDALNEAGLLSAVRDFFDYNYGGSRIFNSSSVNPSMDTFHLDTRFRLYYALMQTNPAEVVRALRAFSQYLSSEIVFEGTDGFKPDGATFHHQGHYFGYARYCVATLSQVVKTLSNTPFAITPAAYARLKHAALTMRFYCQKTEAPLSLQGRHPFEKSNDLVPVLFANLAFAAGTKPDPELAAAYLRIAGTTPEAAELRAAGYRPESEPQGNLTVNYGAFSVHRREHWMAVAKGNSRYVWGQETYQHNNRFGRYLGNGTLFIHQGQEPITAASSGYVEPGWDWNMLDGATVIRLPLDQLRAKAGTEMLRTTQSFVGGLSHRASQGIFTTAVEGAKQHSPGFTARKSFFFADNLICCLGSDIRTADKDHEALTCLFQSAFTPGKSRLMVDDRLIASLPSTGQTGPEGGWLLNPAGTGIVLPPGVLADFRLARQKSRNQQDTQDTVGDFATAWISHGVMPRNAAYQYLAVPAATPDRLKQLASELKDPARSPVKVLKQDSRCHAVAFPRLGLWSAALFVPQPTPFMPGLQAVSRPCLIIIEKDRDNLLVSWADPDLRLKPEGSYGQVSVPADTELTFTGNWDLATSKKAVKVVSRDAAATVIRLTGKDGLGVEFRLKPSIVATKH